MVWVVFALMTGAAVLTVLWPLSRARMHRARSRTDATFYREQLDEVERDAGRGMIAPGELEPARAEVARRYLAANDRAVQEPPQEAQPRSAHRIGAAALMLVAIPAVALSAYGFFGTPDAPDEPLARRRAAEAELDSAFAPVEAELAKTPGDGNLWLRIGIAAFQAKRWDKAAKAYHEAIRILGSKLEWQENLGLARVQLTGGSVDDEAFQAFTAVLQTDPKAPRSQYFVALGLEQRGKLAEAASGFDKFVADYPDLPIAGVVKTHVAELRAAMEQRSGPGSAAGAAIASLAPGDQNAAIRGMVAGLAAKLAASPKNPQGWLQLVRSYSVLKEPEKARTALADARKALVDDKPGLGRLDDLARELGIGGT